MLQVPQTRIVREAISSPLAVEEYGLRELLEARASFWEYRIAMNPRFVLRLIRFRQRGNAVGL